MIFFHIHISLSFCNAFIDSLYSKLQVGLYKNVCSGMMNDDLVNALSPPDCIMLQIIINYVIHLECFIYKSHCNAKEGPVTLKDAMNSGWQNHNFA